MGVVGCIAKGIAEEIVEDYIVGKITDGLSALLGPLLGAEELPPPSPPQPAVTVTHQTKHTSMWAAVAGVLAGIVVGAVLTAAAVFVIGATGGLAIAAVGVGVAVVAGPLISGASSWVTGAVDSFFPAEDGPVLFPPGVPDVFVRGLPAGRAGLDKVGCVKHSTPPLIAEGSDTVFVNGYPLARIDDKVACGSTLKQGVETVMVGGEKALMVEIADEFAGWQRALLTAIEYLVPPSKCLTKGIRNLPGAIVKNAKNLGALFKAGGKMLTNAGKAGGKMLVNAGKATLNAVVKGIKKGAQLAGEAVKALKTQLSKLKGALKGLMAGACGGKNDCKDKVRDGSSDKPGKNANDPICEGGCPVDTATGAVVERRVDFELGHSLRFVFVRNYDGQREVPGTFGRGWMDSFGEHLRLSFDGELVELFFSDGEVVPFDIASDADLVFNRRFPHLTLERAPGGFWVHDLRDDRTRLFAVAGERGRLVRIADAHDNHVELGYADGQLVSVRHSDGPTLAVRRVVDEARRTIITFERTDVAIAVVARYTLDRGLLVEAESTSGYHLFYRYDDLGRMVRWNDTAKTWATYEYDGRGRVIRSRAAEGLYSIDLEYDEAARTTRLRDGKGQVTTYSFNEQRQLLRRVSPLGRTDLYEYNRHGQRIAHTDPAGNVWRQEYDPVAGVLIRRFDRRGAKTELFYDDDLRVIVVLDALEQAWQYERDERGGISSVTAPDGSRYEYQYNAKGQLAQVSRTGDSVRRFEYDERGRLVLETDWTGQPHRNSYDTQDRLVEAIDPLGRSERLFYDPRDRVAAIRHVDGSQRDFGYDSEHNLVRRTDENDHSAHAEFGAFDLQRAAVDSEGRRYTFDYDPDQILVTRVRAPNGRDYLLERDADGRVVREVDYHGSVTRLVYDAAGNVCERVNAVGQVVRYQHDHGGHVTQIMADDEATVFERDALGRLVRAENPACRLEWKYDKVGRVLQSVQNGDIIDYFYDPAGHCTGRTLRAGVWQKVAHTAQYARDAQGRLIGLELAGERLEISRDPLGQPVLFRGARGYQLQQVFNDRGALVEQRGPASIHREYSYDPALNLSSVRDAHWGRTDYDYDRSDRVLSARRQRAGEEQFGYDEVGLLARSERHLPGVDRVIEFATGATGRLRSTGDTEHDYDDAGRLVRKTVHRKGFRPQVWEFRWDSQDQLAEVHTADGQIWRYGYDPLGRRVRKYNPGTRESVHFIWDGDVLLREVYLSKPRGAGHDQQEIRVVHWQHEPGTFVPLARVEAGQLAYVVNDQLGTSKELVTPEGEISWRAHHAVWGEVLAQERRCECPVRFQGQYEDVETGLYYNRFRYYDPRSARYLSQDPIGLAGGLQPDAYVHNPNTWVDPLGLSGCGETPHTVSGSRPPNGGKTGPPNSIWEQRRADGSRSVTYFDAQGRRFSREDYGQISPHGNLPVGVDGRTAPHEHRYEYGDRGPIGESYRELDINGKPIGPWIPD